MAWMTTGLRGGMAAMALLGAGGCAGPLNQESSLGDRVLINSLEGIDPPPQPVGPIAVGEADAVSVTSLDRSNWTARRFVVPITPVYHQPLYARHPRYTDSFARQRGEFPGADTVLDTASDWNDDKQVQEALAEPFWSALDILLFPVRAVRTPPWETTWSPRTAYERGPDGLGVRVMPTDEPAPFDADRPAPALPDPRSGAE